MARNKQLAYKLRLIRVGKERRSVPAWIIAKTKGTVRWSPKNRRNWRNARIKD
jgi:ribosomal protein L39E